MATTTLLVDGMLSGTGVRDAINGGYLEPRELKLSADLSAALAAWVSEYRLLHMEGYVDAATIEHLDQAGRALATRLAAERRDHLVGYYSDALLQRIALPHA
jgi:hypothetical protein